MGYRHPSSMSGNQHDLRRAANVFETVYCRETDMGRLDLSFGLGMFSPIVRDSQNTYGD